MVGRAQSQEKTSQILTSSRQHSGCRSFFVRFTRFACFANDRMTRSWLRMELLGASGCFSAWLRGSSRGTQLEQKRWHSEASLRQGQHRAARLPRAVHCLNQRTSQHQLVVHTGHHLRPAFRLLGGAQARLIPQEHLFVQSVAMLLGGAQAIGRTDLSQGSRFVAFPHTPTRPAGSRALPWAPWRMTWITLSSISRA
jgi:hypothetical protein